MTATEKEYMAEIRHYMNEYRELDKQNKNNKGTEDTTIKQARIGRLIEYLTGIINELHWIELENEKPT